MVYKDNNQDDVACVLKVSGQKAQGGFDILMTPDDFASASGEKTFFSTQWKDANDIACSDSANLVCLGGVKESEVRFS